MTMDSIDDLDARFRLRRVAHAIPADMRPKWRIVALLLILTEASRGGSASLQKIQILSWILRLPRQWEDFAAIAEGRRGAKNLVVRYDPAVNRTIEYAVAEGLVSVTDSGRIVCLDKGKEISRKIVKDADVFNDEIKFLGNLKKHLSEEAVTKLLTWGV